MTEEWDDWDVKRERKQRCIEMRTFEDQQGTHSFDICALPFHCGVYVCDCVFVHCNMCLYCVCMVLSLWNIKRSRVKFFISKAFMVLTTNSNNVGKVTWMKLMAHNTFRLTVVCMFALSLHANLSLHVLRPPFCVIWQRVAWYIGGLMCAFGKAQMVFQAWSLWLIWHSHTGFCVCVRILRISLTFLYINSV